MLDADVTSLLVLSVIPLVPPAAGRVFPFPLPPWSWSVEKWPSQEGRA